MRAVRIVSPAERGRCPFSSRGTMMRNGLDEVRFSPPELTEEERETILVKWNATDRPLPPDAHVIPLFEEQVERSPDSTAASAGGRRISYRNLNRRANQIARLLRREGVASESIVGLLCERG